MVGTKRKIQSGEPSEQPPEAKKFLQWFRPSPAASDSKENPDEHDSQTEKEATTQTTVRKSNTNIPVAAASASDSSKVSDERENQTENKATSQPVRKSVEEILKDKVSNAKLIDALAKGKETISKFKMAPKLAQKIKQGKVPESHLYIWLYKEHFDEIELMTDVEKQIEAMIEYALYIGIDEDYARFTEHIQAASANTPFDIFLREQLSQGKYFAVVYFNEKTVLAKVLETMAMNAFGDFPQSSLWNKIPSVILSDAIVGYSSDDFCFVLLALLNEAVTNRKRAFFTTDNHIRNAKKYFAIQKKQYLADYNDFMQKLITELKQCKSVPAAKTLHGFNDYDTALYLHFMVKTGIVKIENETILLSLEEEEEVYDRKLITAFRSLRGIEWKRGNYKNRLLLDGGNGDGAFKLLLKLDGSLKIEVFNHGEGKISENCGVDYVRINQTVPVGMPATEPYTRCVSIDSDANRATYFFTDENNTFHLLDGNRISTLFASYLMDLLTKCGIDLKIAVVQTAYANGASTDYIQTELKIPVVYVPTGMKQMHHKALEYDIGVYFEANGDGTIVFSGHARKSVRNMVESANFTEDQIEAGNKLLTTIEIVDAHGKIGIAITNILMVEIILQQNGWDVKEWWNSYEERPSIQKELNVELNNNKLEAVPIDLQDKIDEHAAKYKNGRAFVQSSGNATQVYCEAASKEDAARLLALCIALVDASVMDVHAILSDDFM